MARCMDCEHETLMVPPPNLCIAGMKYDYFDLEKGEWWVHEAKSHSFRKKDVRKAMADGVLMLTCP